MFAIDYDIHNLTKNQPFLQRPIREICCDPAYYLIKISELKTVSIISNECIDEYNIDNYKTIEYLLMKIASEIDKTFAMIINSFIENKQTLQLRTIKDVKLSDEYSRQKKRMKQRLNVQCQLFAETLFLHQEMDLKKILLDKALYLSFESQQYLIAFLKIYQQNKREYQQDSIIKEYVSLCYRYFTILHGNLDPYTFQLKFEKSDIHLAIDKSNEQIGEILKDMSHFLTVERSIQILMLRLFTQVGLYYQKVDKLKESYNILQGILQIAQAVKSQNVIKEVQDSINFVAKLIEQQQNQMRSSKQLQVQKEENVEMSEEKKIQITEEIQKTPTSLYNFGKSLIQSKQWDNIELIKDCFEQILTEKYDNFPDKTQCESESFYILTSLKIYEDYKNLKPGEQLKDIKDTYLDSFASITEIFNLPKDTFTLAFMISNLCKFMNEKGLVLKFITQWISFLNQSNQQHRLNTALQFLQMAFEDDLSYKTKQGLYAPKLFEILKEKSTDYNLFQMIFRYLDFNDDLIDNLYDGIFAILEAFEVKLGFLTDDNIPLSLVLDQTQIDKINQSKLSKLILDELSKAKASKVRKNLLLICQHMLENYKCKSSLKYHERKILFLTYQNQMTSILQYISVTMDANNLLKLLQNEKKQGQYHTYHRISYALDVQRSLSIKYLVMQFKKKNEIELVKYLHKLNILQVEKCVKGPGIFKDKFYCCLSHVAFRRQQDDPQWLLIENKARENIEQVQEQTRKEAKLNAVKYIQSLLQSEI